MIDLLMGMYPWLIVNTLLNAFTSADFNDPFASICWPFWLTDPIANRLLPEIGERFD